jgi:hypothetical protein
VFDDAMTAQVHDHQTAREREAEAYRQMIDALPLRVHRNEPLTATRRGVARLLSRLADAIAP